MTSSPAAPLTPIERLVPHRARQVRGGRFRTLALCLSVLVHLLAVIPAMVLARRHTPADKPNDDGTVELLMVEQKGGDASPGGQSKDPVPAATPPAEQKPPAKQAEAKLQPKADTDADKKPPMPVTPAEAAEPVPQAPPTGTTPDIDTKPAPAPPPVPPRQQAAPQFNLAGTDSDTTAEVLAGRVLPAMPDDRYRNRPPEYPAQAAMRGETGTVALIIHVAPNGMASGVDIAQSSGSAALDQSAIAAVRKWHFRPGMRDGQPIGFDMPFRFIFSDY